MQIWVAKVIIKQFVTRVSVSHDDSENVKHLIQ